MIKPVNFLFIAFALVAIFAFNGQVNAQSDHPVVTALQPKFGQVMMRDLEGSFEFTLSAPFSQIEEVLKTVIDQEWYPTYLSVTSREDEKSAIILKAGNIKNSAASRFPALQELLTPGMLPWKTGELSDKAPAVTAVETDFSDRVTILGQTLKSGLIFTHLFPMIERIHSVHSPFFERGSYNDSPVGRVMSFTVKCNW